MEKENESDTGNLTDSDDSLTIDNINLQESNLRLPKLNSYKFITKLKKCNEIMKNSPL